MIDIETLGKKPGCAILSLGAATFDPHMEDLGAAHSTFYRTIDLTSSMLAGFFIDPETLQWWKEKELAAQLALSHNTSPVIDVLKDFSIWCEMNKIEQVWCQGATFDAPILQEAYEILKLKTPWLFWNVRDTRTAYDICGFNYKTVQNIPRSGTYHQALDDALHQIKCVQMALKNRDVNK